MPIGGRAVVRRLGQELVVPELQRRVHQGACELDHPESETRVRNLRPHQGRTALHDFELTLVHALALFPRPVVRELVLLAQDDLHALCDLGDFLGRDSILDDEPSMLLKKCDLLTRDFAIIHRSANPDCLRL
jgi:hypothetical protein